MPSFCIVSLGKIGVKATSRKQFAIDFHISLKS